jgi:hypothetical protein
LVEAKTFNEDKEPSTYTRNILSILYKKNRKIQRVKKNIKIGIVHHPKYH